MSTHTNAGSDKSAMNRPAATSALGFLSRGLRSVSSIVTSISTIFSSAASEAPPDSDEGSTTSGRTEESDVTHATYGSSSSETGSSHEDEEPRPDDITLRNPRRSSSVSHFSGLLPDHLRTAAPPSRRLEVVQPRRVIQSPLRRLSRSPEPSVPSTSNVNLVPSPSGSGAVVRPRAPIRREGAFYGLPPAPNPSDGQHRRRRGQLRREPVYIEGMDPDSINPASELRGRHPSTLPENRYWRDAWGPLPTLDDIVPGGIPDVRTVIGWLQRRYGHSTEPFWLAVEHLFPLPDGAEYRPRFERIVRTSEWRNQGDDWVGGIEPVGRVREPARADDAADSEADIESVGYLSDDNSSVSGDASTSSRSGSSSMALVPFSASASSSRALGLPSPPPSSSSSSSPFAPPSITGPSRKRARESDSDAGHPATPCADAERPANRRRLDPDPTAVSGPSPIARRRHPLRTPYLAPRNASFTYPVAAPRSGRTDSLQQSSPLPRALPEVPQASSAEGSGQGLPVIVFSPPSPCPSATSAAQPAEISQEAGPSSAPSASSSQLLLPPPAGRGRSRRRSSVSAPQDAVTAGGQSAASTNPVAGSSTAQVSNQPSRRQSRVLRPRKRARDDSKPGEGSGDEPEEPSPEDAERKKKRPKRG
ncbi:hypothetical protein BD414DRAFT_539241 [Trametes punicea]|nr:hypothetical protein BD414DRAFT_539241 [Trametes punicea]